MLVPKPETKVNALSSMKRPYRLSEVRPDLMMSGINSNPRISMPIWLKRRIASVLFI